MRAHILHTGTEWANQMSNSWPLHLPARDFDLFRCALDCNNALAMAETDCKGH